MDRRPTLHDVAHAANVSPRTVARAIQHDPRVAPATAERILTLVAELGYRRNEMARALRVGDRTASIALVTEDLANPFYSVVAKAVEMVALSRGSRLFVASSEEDSDRERSVVLDLLDRRVDGILLVPTASDHTYLQREVEAGASVVCLDRPAPRLSVDTVLIDNLRGARAGVTELIRRGHRRIAALCDAPGIWTVRQRLRGYQAALSHAGIAVDDALVSFGAHTPRDAARELGRLLSDRQPPTAFFCVNNQVTLGTVLALAQMGRQLDVVGFDDFDSADLIPFEITIIAHDPAMLGQAAAELLFRRIDGHAATPKRVIIPTTLRRRGRR